MKKIKYEFLHFYGDDAVDLTRFMEVRDRAKMHMFGAEFNFEGDRIDVKIPKLREEAFKAQLHHFKDSWKEVFKYVGD